MLDLIRKHLAGLSAEYAEIRIEKKEVLSLLLSNSRIENISRKNILSGNVRVLKEGQWGFVSFSGREGVDRYVRLALSHAALAARSVHEARKVKDHPPVSGCFRTSFQKDPFTVSLEEKHALLLDYDRILRGFPGVVNRTLNYLERKEELFFGNTEGSRVSQEKTFTGISVQAVARDGNNIQTGRDSWGGYRGYEAVLGRQEEVEKTGRTAEGLLEAGLAEAGRYDVILDQKLAGVFAHEAFGHLSEADFLYENPEMLALMPLGRRFGIPELNIIDEGNIGGEAGQIFVDDEGVLPGKTHLIKNGVLNGRLHSRETAFRMNEELTGNARSADASFQPIVRMTNTYIDRGGAAFDQMLGSLEDGIYAVDYVGGQTNLEMFTFSAGHAFRVKNGKIGKMLKNVVLSGNVFGTLLDMEMIGNDLKLFGGLGGCGKGGQGVPVSTGGPHVKIKSVLVGGI